VFDLFANLGATGKKMEISHNYSYLYLNVM